MLGLGTLVSVGTLAEIGGLEQELLEVGRGFSSIVDELPPVPGVGVHGGQLRGSDRGQLARRIPQNMVAEPAYLFLHMDIRSCTAWHFG